MVGKSEDIVEMAWRRNLDFCSLQETRWKVRGERTIEGAGKRYKLYWLGGDEKSLGVRMLVADKWVDKVMDVTRRNDRIMLVKVLVVNIVSAYAPQAGKTINETETF